ncbi:hypothetical protein V9T40_005265 [Parthenolecanium corni]|uniref:GDNF/GAS1 domain-containing protein n=1 Tax=Parthenolecanium corni TaxID=536013 RepID=A0AAN9TDT2_9HEMI
MLSVVMVLAIISAATGIPCESANQQCSFRTGCSMALQEYVRSCSIMLHRSPDSSVICPEVCKNALIALTSTDEGRDLMTCECTEKYCKEAKRSVEVCRPHVMNAVRKDAIVTCEVAQLICQADATCAKALEYYNAYCRSVFVGRKCSARCKNSIAILRKQEKSAKLDSCRCTGREDYNCVQIRMNTARLCFNQTLDKSQVMDNESNDVTPYPGSDNVNSVNDIVDFTNGNNRAGPPLTVSVAAIIASMALTVAPLLIPLRYATTV